jgi:membrane-bound lytic murein transglycosylase D
MFGDWTTVLAAYNCGEHRVNRTIQEQNINYLDNFWDLYERLPRETARYVPRFLATLQIVHSPEKYGLKDVALQPPLEFETVPIPKQTNLKSISQATGVDEGVLRDLNPELRRAVLPAEGYELRVPVGDAEAVLAKLDDIPAYRPEPAYRARTRSTAHKVRRGETLSGIAQRYRTDVNTIMLANNMRKPRSLRAGQTLRIPAAWCPPANKSRDETVSRSSGQETRVHEVRRGDSLWNIAKRYGTTVAEIQRLNRIGSTTLSIGQVLKISSPSTPAKSPETPSTQTLRYRVRSGDNPFTIAKRYNMSVERLLSLNNLDPDEPIHPGQLLVVED